MQSEKYISDISNNIVKKSTTIVVEKNNNVDYDSDTEGNPIVPFWINNPNILFQQQYISEFFPIDSMTYEQKLNAITRSVILLTIIGFLFTNSIRLLLISCITIGAIFLVYYYHELEKSKNL